MIPAKKCIQGKGHQQEVVVQSTLLSADKLPALLKTKELHTVFRFAKETAIDTQDQRLVSIGLDQLGDTELVEAWWGKGPVSYGQQGRIRYSEDGTLLFGHMLLRDDSTADPIETVRDCYREIIAFLQASDYPHLYRCWNFLPHINQVDAQLERYKSFCIGRHAALSGASGFELNLPAASAIGTHTPGMLISFAASRVKPIQIENPRQISAFHYPPMHSPRSPLFSRAVWMDWEDSQRLYLSGTASIRGHETVHEDDLKGQIDETLHNIRAILENIPDYKNNDNPKKIQDACLRVYLRHREHYPIIKYLLESHLGTHCSVTYLKGDICRAQLLLEIEGVFDQVEG